jgi:hypothetical protein
MTFDEAKRIIERMLGLSEYAPPRSGAIPVMDLLNVNGPEFHQQSGQYQFFADYDCPAVAGEFSYIQFRMPAIGARVGVTSAYQTLFSANGRHELRMLFDDSEPGTTRAPGVAGSNVARFRDIRYAATETPTIQVRAFSSASAAIGTALLPNPSSVNNPTWANANVVIGAGQSLLIKAAAVNTSFVGFMLGREKDFQIDGPQAPFRPYLEERKYLNI